MQIACPNCHTRYALDDRLVPPGGAPVQCTRCGLVFTAQRGDAGAQGQQPAPSGTLPFGSAARSQGPIRTEAYGQNPPAPAASTQVFGSGPAAAVPPAPPPGGGRTQVFGVGETARTQVFGAGAAAPRPPAPANRTQVFGSGAASPGLPPESPPAARTQVFGGAGGASAPPPEAPPVARTQVFGGAAVRPPSQAEPPPAMRTQVFGGAAAPPPGPPAPPMRTAVFGGAAAQTGSHQEGLDLPPMSGDDLLAGGVPSLELPGTGAEAPPLPGVMTSRPPRPDPAERALAAELRRRRQRAIWGVLGLVVLGLVAYAGWSWFAGRSAVPASIRADRDDAFALLRRDNPQSRAAALKALDALVERYPQWVGARATQALAQTLELDDQRALLRRGLVGRRGAEDQPGPARGGADPDGLEGTGRRGPDPARAAQEADRSDGGRGERAGDEAERQPGTR